MLDEPRRAGKRKKNQVQKGVRATVSITVLAITLIATFTLTHFGGKDERANGAEPQRREFTLVASEFDWEIEPGVVVRAWGYNEQIAGPEIRVREGDLVRITLVNHLPVATTIHWHGVHVPPEMDGPAGLNQAPVEPGQSFVYEFTATPAGTRMYHSHTDVVTQAALGLYGAFIIEPQEPDTTYDKEFVYLLSEWDLELSPDVAMGKVPRGPRDVQLRGGEIGADLFLMNGHTHDAIPPIAVAEGDRVLIRLINMGSLVHPIHIHGHSLKVVATDGNQVPPGAQLTKDTIAIAPGERYDLELIAENPGVWMVHCHIESHAANGMMTLLEYEGSVPTGPLKEFWGTPDAGLTQDHSGHTTPGATAETAGSPDVSQGDGVTVLMLDDHFEPRNVQVSAGATVTFVNRGANWHTVAAIDQSFESGQINPGESFSVTLDSPGMITYICKHHLRHGMSGTIEVMP